MFPFFRYSWIFRSRWMALLWAAGICWMAVEWVGPEPQGGNSATVATDATGAQISPDDVKRIEDGLKNF